MVLVFESKTYESLSQRVLFSIFKYGYIAQKYQIFSKITYLINIFVEILLTIFLISIDYKDLTNKDIHNYGNIYNSNFNQTKFQYQNFDSKMSFFINFFDFLTKTSQNLFYFVVAFILLFFLIKVAEFFYFFVPKISVINAKGIKRIMFYILSFQDQMFKTYFDLLVLTLTVSVFSCKDSKQIFYETECYSDSHLVITVLCGFILFIFLIYSIIQSFFYDPCNLINKDNFGISENLVNDLILILQKIGLVICDCFFLINQYQGIIKLGIYAFLSLCMLYFIYKNQYKFHNFYQNIIIVKTVILLVYSVVLLLYIVFDKKMNIFIFLITLGCSVLMGSLVFEVFKRAKTFSLYTREHNLESYPHLIYVIEMILRYQSNKIYKIIINGFIQCYNIEYDESKEKCQEIDSIIGLSKNDSILDLEYHDQQIQSRKDLIKPNNVKYLLTIVNMLILGSVREIVNNISKRKETKTIQSFKQRKLLEFMTEIIFKHSIKSHEYGFQFKMLTAQIFLRKLNNHTRAWFILSNFYETFNKFGVRQQFNIFCMYQELYETLQEGDTLSTHKAADIKKIIKLEKSNNKFIHKISKCTNRVKLFWLNYMNEKQKHRFLTKNINKTLHKINSKYNKLQIFFTEIQKLFEDNRNIFYIYCCFLKNIMNNEQLAEHITKLLKDNKKVSPTMHNTQNETNLETYSPIPNDFIDDDYYKMFNIETVGLLIVSCNNLEIGKIKWCNKKISHMLLYSKSDLSKLKINRIIPPIIANKHNDFVKSFIQSNVQYYSNITRVNFMINADDYIVPFILYMNIFPRIKNGIEMSAMVTKVLDGTFILYKNPEIKIRTKLCFVLINEDGSIEAVDKNANTYLGIPNLVRNGWKTKITIDKRKCNLFELSPGLKRFLNESNGEKGSPTGKASSTKNNNFNINNNQEQNNTNKNVGNNKFVHECELDTSLLTDEFYNDEYGLFLSINKRINYLINRNLPINSWTGGVEYYDVSMEEEELNLTNNLSTANAKDGNSNVISSSRLKHEYSNIIVPNIFKVHTLTQEIYEMSSSQPDEIPLHLYLIKYYFPIDSFKNFKETEKNAQSNTNVNTTTGIVDNKNVSISPFMNQHANPSSNTNVNSIISPSNTTTPNINTKRLSGMGLKSLLPKSRKNSGMKQPNKFLSTLGTGDGRRNVTNILPSNTNALAGGSLQKQQTSPATNNINTTSVPVNEFSNTSSIIKNTFNTKYNITQEKIHLRKEIMFQDKITEQSSSYKIIQILFLIIIIGLVIIISLEVYYRMTEINYLKPLHNVLFLCINRRDTTTNLLLNTLWHIETENEIVNAAQYYPLYNITNTKIIDIQKQDIINLKSYQDQLFDYSTDISKYKIFPSDTTTSYEYDAFHKIKNETMLINSVYDLLISNYDKYFQYDSFKLRDKRRLLELLNPEFYLNTTSFEQSELESRILNIFINAYNLIKISDTTLIHVLTDYLIETTDKDLEKLVILGIIAISFTFVISLGVAFLFLKLNNKQDILFETFICIDFTCAIKISVICDKFLKILTHLNTTNAFSVEQLNSFYHTDHAKLYSLITVVMRPRERRQIHLQPTLNSTNGQQRNSTCFLKDNSSISSLMMGGTQQHVAYNRSSSIISNESLQSSNLKGKWSCSGSAAYGLGYINAGIHKRRGSDEELILRYKRFAEENKKKRGHTSISSANGSVSHLEGGINSSNELSSSKDGGGVKIIKEKKVTVNTFLIFFLFVIILCGFFSLLLVFDFKLNNYVNTILSYLHFQHHRFYYSVNNVLWFELLLIKSTNDNINTEFLELYLDFLNGTFTNEEQFHKYIIDSSFKQFNSAIQAFDSESNCVIFSEGYIDKQQIHLSNNISKLTREICDDASTNVTVQVNKPINEIILYSGNVLRKMFNLFYLEDKTEDNILKRLNDDLLQYIIILSQFVIRQSVHSICNILNKDFSDFINRYSMLCIALFVVFVAVIIIVIFVANVCAFLVFKGKKRRNILLINLMPDEFIIKQLEGEEEEKERKKEVE